VEDGTGEEPGTEPVSKPRQVAGIAGGRRSAGLNLNGDHITAAEFDEEVDLVTPVLFPQMIQTRASRAELSFGSDLSEDEGVDDPSEQVPIT
jgi:hypothetical protein